METVRYRILLIEDEELYRRAFLRFVEEEKLPYDCTIAKSVSQAQSILASERFDIVVADYSLGDGTAFDIIDLVKGTPIIFVTGIGDEQVVIKAWKSGAYDYLIKDLERNYLKRIPITIENAINHKKAKEQVQLLSAAIMSTDDNVYITDMDNKIIFVNRAFCETYGYDQNEILGTDSSVLCAQSFPGRDEEDIYQSLGSREVEFYHKRKDGDEFPVSLSRSVIKDEKGNEIARLGVARDIAERILIEDKIRNINLKLKSGIRTSNQMLSSKTGST